MFEKVNPSHPDKLADRIAGALVDYAYTKEENPKIAVEVLLGHGNCYIISETSVTIPDNKVREVVDRIVGVTGINITYKENKQDEHLAENQEGNIKCGDNGIFKGVPITNDEFVLSDLVMKLYKDYPTDGKFIKDNNMIIACQSCVDSDMLKGIIEKEVKSDGKDGKSIIIVNPLGDWTGGPNVDCGATNRKLGSDMGFAVTGGGLHGKDLSKGDVSINIYAYLKAQYTKQPVEISCAIGNTYVDKKPYAQIVEIARNFIRSVGGFEKFAEWGFALDYWRQNEENWK